jgi:DNA-binding NarL/FixJ family response regulator
MSETVLIVDDHAGFRTCAREFLEAAGFTVVGEAADAASGIAAVADLHPDVVLLDVQLPDIDGVRAAKQIAARDGGTAIVLTSSRDLADCSGPLDDTPARGFLLKSDLSGEAIRELVA